MLKEMIRGANGAWKGAKRAVSGLSTVIQNIAKTVGRYNKENFISAFRQSVEHTMPIRFHIDKAEDIPSKNIIRRLADMLLLPPFSSLPGWITGLFLLPLVYYTYKNTLSFFQIPIDLVYYDRKKRVELNWHGGLYGLLGAAVGLIFGSVVGSMALVWRTLEQTWHTTASLLTRLINWSVSDLDESNVIVKPKIQVKKYRHADRTDFEKFLGFYAIGWVVSLVTGTITLGAIGIGRFAVNTAISAWRGFAHGLKLSVIDMAPETHTAILLKDEYRNRLQRYFFGGLGTFAVGPVLGIVAFTTYGIIRVFGNSIDSFIRVTLKTARVFLRNTAIDAAFDIGEDPREDTRVYGYSIYLGYPGQFLLGIPAIALGTGIGMGSRFIIETGISFINTARVTFNLALQNTRSYKPFTPLKAQRAGYERAIGFLGYFLGVVVPAPVTLSIVLGRTLMTNLITANNFAKFFLKENSTLHGAIEVQAEATNEGEEETIHFFDVYAEEAPITAETPIDRAAINIEPQKSRLVRFSSWLKKVNSSNGADERPVWLQILSSPGIVIGSLLGGGLRAIVETTLTSIDTVSTILNLALYKSRFANQFKPIKPNRNTLEKNLGAFGYILGGAFGATPFLAIGTTRWVITNGDSANRAFITTVNTILANSDPQRLDEPEADTRPNIVKASSILGYMVGSILGLSREIGLNTIRSFGRQTRYYGKAALFQSGLDSKIADSSEDIRTLNQKRLGYFGLFAGTGFGWIAYGSITLARITGNSVISAYHTVRDMIEMAFLDDYPTSDTFTETRRMKALLVQSQTESGARNLDGYEYEIVSMEDDDIPVAQPTDENHPLDESHPQRREDNRKNRPFALGTPGLALGGIIGVGAFAIAGSGRILLNSLFTAWNITLDFTDKILPEGVSTESARIPQNKPIPRLMGYPIGTLLGTFATGPLAWSAVFLYRLMANTAITSFLVADIITTLPPIRDTIKAHHDSRKLVDKHFGLAGFVLGGFAFSIAFGSVGYVMNMAWHTAYHSAISGFRSFMYTMSWTMGSRTNQLIVGVDQNEFEKFFAKDKRTPFERYGFGFIGGVVGPILSLPISTMIATVRLAFLNGKLFLMGFMRAANLTLEKPFSAQQMALLDKSVNKLPLGQKPMTLSAKNLNRLKYQFGAIGFIIGGISGAIFVAAPVGLYRIAKESARSYYHLSQSLLNVGLEEPYFEKGIATDQRPAKMKVLGGLGYVAALVTTGLVPVANGLTKLATVALAFSFSGFVAIYKAIKIQHYPRFKPIDSNQTAAVAADEKLRKLVSVLKYGELPSETSLEEELVLNEGNAIIIQNKTGRKGAEDFIVKSLCFDEERLSESILYAKVKKNQRGENTHLTGPELKAIKEKHHGSFFFTTKMRQKHDAAIDQRCDDVNRFVDNYVAGQRIRTPKKEEHQLSVQELFNYKP